MTTDSSSRKDYSAPPALADYLIFFALAIPILVVDQFTKFWVEGRFPVNIKNFVWEPYLSWSHVHNTGGTFGLLEGQTAIFALLALIVAGGLIIFNFRHPYRARKLRVALGMVFGGAMGNLADRLRLGHVTDFIDIDVSSVVPAWVPHNIADWYIFNVADIFIIGAIIFMFYLIFFEPEEIEPSTHADSAPLSVPTQAQSAELRSVAQLIAILSACTALMIGVGYLILSGTFSSVENRAALNSFSTIPLSTNTLYLAVGLVFVGILGVMVYQALVFRQRTVAQSQKSVAANTAGSAAVTDTTLSPPPPTTLPLPQPYSAEKQRTILVVGAAVATLIMLIWQSYKENK